MREKLYGATFAGGTSGDGTVFGLFIMFCQKANELKPASSRMMGFRAERAAGKEPLLADSCEFGKSNSRPQSKQILYVRCLIVNTRLR